ncbi:hypothetical protein JM18_008157 [Phytophthora kernoviae]|uniref:Myb-like domain-containing protein n=2 Tax=Phytophthora kernoviae TaxID=325452 RepID=A0A921SAQ5_9STRA|nr:hypothetical protein G195_010496 [Phytophthora kernoviae 00238/432]KAG2515434.1 hypothetical protein JM18_008157 [Phytophthora kernoviae]
MFNIPHERLLAFNQKASSSHTVQATVHPTQNLLLFSRGKKTTVAANAAATAAGGYAFPRNSPEFACENVGERVKGKRRKYCPHEVTALVLGVQRYADDSCPWSSILRDPHLGHLFHGRSGVDLKDKWRTLIKTRPELAQYTENRKNHRKYRPFTKIEEDALMDGKQRSTQGQVPHNETVWYNVITRGGPFIKSSIVDIINCNYSGSFVYSSNVIIFNDDYQDGGSDHVIRAEVYGPIFSSIDCSSLSCCQFFQ